MNLKNINSIHFVGIKGVAMTALAIVAKEMGKRVSGSDVSEEFPTDETLRRFNLEHNSHFSPQNIPHDTDLVIYTGAHQGRNNIEVVEAIKRGLPVLPHGQALGLFMQGKRGISVAGSHGKTTTSALIASVLTHARVDPSYAVGCGEIMHLRTPAHWGKGAYFVAEADEYVTDPRNDQTPRFLWQFPDALIITNIDFDHPDVYQNLQAVQKAFTKFVGNVKNNGFVILNDDDLATMEIQDKINNKVITYGKSETADFYYKNISFRTGRTEFTVWEKGQPLGQFLLHIPGEHNIKNALAAVAACKTLGISIELIKQGLAAFKGTKRRFELIGEKNGKLLYDDYAHHPREIRATFEAVKKWFPNRRLLVIFQPHTYTRTQALLTEFSQCFNDCDMVLISNIYASAREKPIPGLTSMKLADVIRKYKRDVIYAPDRDSVVQYLEAKSRSNDLILIMGAGDIYSWIPAIFEAL